MMYNVWSRVYKKDFILEHGIEFPKKNHWGRYFI